MKIAVDLDRTLAYYKSDYLKLDNFIGEPIKPMVDMVKKWIKNEHEIVIFTARVAKCPQHKNIPKTRQAIENWCVKHIGKKLKITAVKTPGIDLIIDDKAIGILPNQGIVGMYIDINKDL